MERTNREKGDLGENAVAEHLVSCGYEIVERNFTVRGGEIDIIAKKDDTLCFVEVKTRRKGAMVSGETAVTAKKRRFIIRTAEIFHRGYEKRFGEIKCRFDVAAAELDGETVLNVRYYPAAFDLSGI